MEVKLVVVGMGVVMLEAMGEVKWEVAWPPVVMEEVQQELQVEEIEGVELMGLLELVSPMSDWAERR